MDMDVFFSFERIIEGRDLRIIIDIYCIIEILIWYNVAIYFLEDFLKFELLWMIRLEQK